MSEPLHHIALADEWAAARPTGRYERSTLGASLAEVGFIHCSTAAQVLPTAERFYGEVTDELVVLTIDPDRLGDEVRYEPVPGGERFPHLYGPLPVAAVVAVSPLHRRDDGFVVGEPAAPDA